MENYFDYAVYPLVFRIRSILKKISPCVKENVQEIRLRVNLPISITMEGKTVFVEESGNITHIYKENLPTVSQKEIEESYYELCGRSVFAHEEEIKNGFIAMGYGCRAGVCGTLSKAGFLRDITSINIRIAHQIKGAADQIIKEYSGGGLLICGPPGSGKTTVLRDLICQLSGGVKGRYYRIAVIDSRYEISGAYDKNHINNLGFSYDLMITSNKAKGIEISLRTMFPEIIAFDEIGTTEELKAIRDSFFSGVDIITTAHIGEKKELFSREITRELIKSGTIAQVALLPKTHRGKINVFSCEELVLSNESDKVGLI